MPEEELHWATVGSRGSAGEVSCGGCKAQGGGQVMGLQQLTRHAVHVCACWKAKAPGH